MTQVKVQRISSVTDPTTGQPAKQIELVEVKSMGRGQPFGVGDDSRMVQNIVSQFQSMGIMPPMGMTGFTKISMILTENEYDMLGIRLDVNEVYDLEIKGGAIMLKPSTGV